MRPITLTLSGLHSFREKQVIDFETLREAGVFGIFGPTGSGKSSILDALTLALYGKVERAPNNTQGIMNHAENTLSVSFTFEIGQGDSSRRYRVERTYKRVDQLSIRTSACRLIEVADGEVVLADKEREVTASVQQILGLTLDDFTRAVVLPQGKFAEFLSLRGSERRKMLERLFHLERYGDRLNARLKEKLQTAEANVNEIIAAQAELSATTEEAVDEAKQQKHEGKKQLEQIEEQLHQMEKTYEKTKQLWEWQREKQTLLHSKAELEEHQQTINALKIKLEKAEEAEKLKPYYVDWQQRVKAVSECEAEYKRVKEQLVQMTTETEAAKQAYIKKRQQLETDTPVLIQQIERFKTAQKLEVDLDEMRREKIECQADYENMKATLENEQSQLQSLQTELEYEIKQRTNLETQMKEVKVDANERNRLQQAVFDKQQVDSLLQTIEQLKEESIKKETEFKRLDRAYKQELEHHKRHKQQAHSLFQKIEKLYLNFADVRVFIDQQREKLKREIESIKVKLEEEKLRELAHELQAQLVAGEPCPVCGSTTHELTDERKQSTLLKEKEQQLERFETFIDKLNDYERKITYYLQDLKKWSEMIYAHLEGESIDLQPVQPLQKMKESESYESLITKLERQMKAIEQDVIHIEEQKNEFERIDRERQQQLFEFDVQRTNSEKAFTESKANYEAHLTTYNARLQQWNETYAELSLDTVELELASLIEKEERYGKLDEQLNEVNERIDQQKRRIEEQTSNVNKRHMDVEIQHSKLIALKEEIGEKEAGLKTLVGERVAIDLLQQSERRLETLRTEAYTAQEHFEQCEKQLNTLQNKETSVRERLYQLKEREKEATKRWDEKWQQSRFDHVTELEQNFVDREERQAWSKKISDFETEWHTLHHDLQRLEKQLGDQYVTEAEWHEIEQALQEIKQAHRDSLKQSSEAEYHYKQVVEQYERFQQLETEREKIQTFVNSLKKLESVLRGKAFVEFMAEEQLIQVTREASKRLGRLTNQRYAIEVNSEGGFVIRDDANGGVRRPISTLSGGETFLTSLALALSLSSHIQLRGKYPLEFFFLDEGFGTLDQDLLETVITSLEKLHMENVSIGLISHVPELKSRLARKLIVHPAEPAGAGSRLTMSS